MTRAGEPVFLVRAFAGEVGGKRVYLHQTVHGSPREAQRVLTALLAKIDEGGAVAPTKTTLDAFLDVWLEAVRPTLRPKTFANYRDLLARYIRPAIGSKAMTRVAPLDVQAIYSAMVARGLSPRTVQYTHTVLRAALQYAVDQEIIRKNPARRPKLPPVKRDRAHEEIRALDAEQLRQFLAVAEEHYLYPVFALALSTGMRPSEYLALRWKDLDFEAGQLAVTRTVSWVRKKTGRGTTFAFDDVKRKRSRRTLDIGDQLVRVLRAHKKRQSAIRLANADAWENLDLVFTKIDGRPLDQMNVFRRFRALLKRAGLPPVRLYDLRHTYATNALASGISAKVVSARLGHASVAFTLDTYAHVLPAQEKDAATSADDLVFGEGKRSR